MPLRRPLVGGGAWACPTLIFAITTLDLLMYAFLNFALKNPCSRRFIETCYFEDVCCVDPIIGPPPHQTFALDFELIDGYLGTTKDKATIGQKFCKI